MTRRSTHAVIPEFCASEVFGTHELQARLMVAAPGSPLSTLSRSGPHDSGYGIAARMVAFCLAVLALATLAHAEETLNVTDAWIRLAPPSAQQHAGYFTLTNSGSAARSLVAAESSAYAKVELHVSRIANGIATMEPVAALEIAPGQTVRFASGGLHLMLIGPKAPLQAGSMVPLTLVLGDGSKLATAAIVRKDGGGGPHGAHHAH
jgi:periplasmic copper chaperone A